MADKADVFAAFLEVQAQVEAIGKNKRVTEGPARFAFRGVDDVMQALHGPMTSAGLICVPQVQERLQETRETRNGGHMNVTHVRVRFAFYGPDGSTFSAETWGEGQDSGDKSTGKAHSMAYKSALLQAFHIPVDDMPDADLDTTPAAPVERRTDLGWYEEFQRNVLLSTSITAVEDLKIEARKKWAAHELSEADSADIKALTDERIKELTPA